MVKIYRELIARARPLAEGEVRTHEDGIAFAADDWSRLRRFLILGSSEGTFYINRRALTVDNAAVVTRCLEADPDRAIRELVEISEQGRAAKHEPVLLALAMAASNPRLDVREEALYRALPRICRTGTHLLHFVGYCKGLRKSSRMYRTALGAWFNAPEPDALAYQAVKYRSRDGWALADVLRLARPTPRTAAHSAVYKWLVDGETGEEVPELIAAVTLLASMTDPSEAARLIGERRIPREAVPTELLNHREVWEALLVDMPITATIRNLAKMTEVGLLTDGSDAARVVADRVTDRDRLTKGRVHPLTILAALKVYEQGRGEKGNLTWTPVRRIVNALDEAFYLAFGAVPGTGKKLCLALDVSSSMAGSRIAGMPFIDCRMASAAMALVTANVEPNVTFVAYSNRLVPIKIRPSMRLDEVIRRIAEMPFGGTFCSLPISAALKDRRAYDAFVSYTDSETWDASARQSWIPGGANVPTESFTDILGRYRSRINPETRSIIVAMTSNGFTLNDPRDPRGLDIAGFDSAAPAVMSDFISGAI